MSGRKLLLIVAATMAVAAAAAALALWMRPGVAPGTGGGAARVAPPLPPLPEADRLPPDVERFEGMSVEETLRELHDRMHVIGETSADLLKWDAAVAGAAEHIAERMKDPTNLPELTRPMQHGETPLMHASMRGYPHVVDRLLEHSSVRASIDQKETRRGMTAFQFATMGSNLTIFVINPKIMEDPFRWVPYLVTTPYFADLDFAPYQRVRAALIAAGADTDTTALREFIEDAPYCPAAVKERVRESDDVFTTLHDIVMLDPEHGLPKLFGEGR